MVLISWKIDVRWVSWKCPKLGCFCQHSSKRVNLKTTAAQLCSQAFYIQYLYWGRWKYQKLKLSWWKCLWWFMIQMMTLIVIFLEVKFSTLHFLVQLNFRPFPWSGDNSSVIMMMMMIMRMMMMRRMRMIMMMTPLPKYDDTDNGDYDDADMGGSGCYIARWMKNLCHSLIGASA